MSGGVVEATGLRPIASYVRLRKNHYRVHDALKRLLPGGSGRVKVAEVAVEVSKELGTVVRSMMKLNDAGLIEMRLTLPGVVDVMLR